MVRARLALVILLLAFPLSAQLTNGQIYLLQTASGKYLSAAQGTQSVYLSANADAWEQWQFRDLGSGNSCLVSFHGTALFVHSNWDQMAVPFHAPWAGLSDYAPGSLGYPAKAEWAAAPRDDGFGVPAGKIVLSSRKVYPDGWYCISDSGGTLGKTYWYAYIAKAPASILFTAIPVAAPAGGRKPDQVEVGLLGTFKLRSYQGTLLMRKWTPNSTGGIGTGETYYYQGVSTSGDPGPWAGAGSMSNSPMKYGDTFMIRVVIGGAPYALQPSPEPATDPLVSFGGIKTSDYYNWTVVDPTGTHRPGDRVAYDTTVSLRNVKTGRFLSCPDNGGRPYLTPNTSPSAWEYWKFVRP